MGEYGDVDGYMEQESEWEREGLLDPTWERQQRKVTYTTIKLNLDNQQTKYIVDLKPASPVHL